MFSFSLIQCIVLLAVIAAAMADPQLLLQSSPLLPASPLLARYIPAPEAPASTAHAAHVAAFAPLPVTRFAYAAPYDYSGYSVSKILKRKIVKITKVLIYQII